MRRTTLAAGTAALLLAGCTPGVVQQRQAGGPQVFSAAPRCAYEVLGTFSNRADLRSEIQSRGGDAAIHVVEESQRGGVNTADPTVPKFYSGQVVRFTDPGCKT
ncbi:MAG TPA: hypothetical protein VHG51_07350 [Longimicrobiaceae bacterium]|nr:hypothetical protein [Longimicrobiaceae bacterium]